MQCITYKYNLTQALFKPIRTGLTITIHYMILFNMTYMYNIIPVVLQYIQWYICSTIVYSMQNTTVLDKSIFAL